MGDVLWRGLTPQRTLEITLEGGTGTTVNVTQLLGTTAVKFEEEINQLDQLTFSIVHGAFIFAANMNIGDRVKFSAGYRNEETGGGTPTRPFFDGYVSSMTKKYGENGRITLDVVAYDVRWRLTRNKPGALAYPAPKYDGEIYPRPWRAGTKGPDGKAALKLSEIVQGILDEHKIPMGTFKINPDPRVDHVFTFIDSIVQNADETDFQFVLRLLTGTGQSRFTGVYKDERRAVNGNAIWFMEVDPLSAAAQLFIVDEASVLGQQGSVAFQWQGVGFPKVPEKDYDPTAPDAVIIAKTVEVKRNMELARNRPQRLRKDVQTGAVGPAGKSAAALTAAGSVRGQESAVFDQGPTWLPRLGGQSFDDGVLIANGVADLPSKPTVPPGLATPGRSDQLNQWAPGREVRYEAPSREIAAPGAGALPKVPNPAPPPPVTLPPGAPQTRQAENPPNPATTKPIGERIQKFGETATLSCPGNIFTQTRRTYSLALPIDLDSGDDWFAKKISHEIGLHYNMTVELGR